jgi:hypothetical protein
MTKPILLSVDDDPDVLRAIERDPRTRNTALNFVSTLSRLKHLAIPFCGNEVRV